MPHNIAKSVHIGNNLQMGNNVHIEDNVNLGHNITLGDNIHIKKDAIIGDNVTIGYRDLIINQIGSTNTEPTVIGENVRVRSGSIIYSGTTLGINSMVGHNSIIRENTKIGHDTYIGSLTSIEGDTIIGNYVGIHTQCHITKYCKIGDYTFIAPLFVGANDAEMSHRRANHGQNLVGFTTEKYVRIAVGVVVLPGVHFGEGCVVGAGSVVTKDVPPYKVVMGTPAKVIRDASREIPME